MRSHSLIDGSARQPPLASPTSWDDDRHQSEQVAKLEFALNHDGTRFERCAYDDLLNGVGVDCRNRSYTLLTREKSCRDQSPPATDVAEATEKFERS